MTKLFQKRELYMETVEIEQKVCINNLKELINLNLHETNISELIDEDS